MAQSFADAAHKLSKPNFDIADTNGNLRFVLNVIETWKIYWLLVFDNFDDPSAFDNVGIKHYFPRGSYASILFTTRHEEVKILGSGIEGSIIDVTAMSEQEASTLLFKRSQAERSDTNIQKGAKIIKRLGYHALAIDQAGAYIAARHLDLDIFTIHYSERQEKVLNEIPKQWDYRRRLKTDPEVMTKLSVFTTWELSVELISGSPTMQDDKIHLLTVAAFLNGNEVSDNLFRCYGSEKIDWLVSCVKDGVWDKYIAQDILTDLQNLSLVQNLHIGENETTFSLHPLIQDWVKLRAKPDARRVFAIEAIILLSTFLKTYDNNETTLSTKQALFSHLEVVLQNEKKYAVLQGDFEEIELQYAAFNFGYFFDSLGRYNLSEQMNRRALKWRERFLGKENLYTLQCMTNLAVALEKQGKHDEAQEIFQQTLQLQEKGLGKNHRDTLKSMTGLATALLRQGKHDEAHQLFQQTLQLQEKVLGKEHPDALASINGLASVFHQQGKYDEAMQVYRQVIQLAEKVLGKDHPNTLQCMTNLAAVLHEQGKYDEAMQEYQQIIQLTEKVLGKDHPNTLQCMTNLAAVLHEQGKYDEAMSILQQTLQLQEKILGKDHPDTLQSMNSLAVVLHQQGKYDEAMQVYRQVIQLAEKVYGKGHPRTITSMNNLGILLVSLEYSSR
jgi:tetratricopeptide (TPR) repeat protein